MQILRSLSRLQSIRGKVLLNQSVFLVHHQGQMIPKQHRLKWNPQQKAILYSKESRIIPKIEIDYYDPLILPGYGEGNIVELLTEFLERKLSLAPTNLCMLIHMFTKYNVMTEQAFDLIEKQAYRLKGQYGARSIFGALQGCIVYDRMKLASFFLEQYRASDKKLTLIQTIQLLQALGKNNSISKETKSQIWNEYFRADFLDGFKNVKIRSTMVLSRIFDLFTDLEEKDKEVWNRMIDAMKGKKGWARVPVIQRLYAISGTNKKAKRLFDDYFNQMAQDEQVLKRYNLTQLRYRSPLEVIKLTEENPSDYYPKIRTLIPEEYNAEEWNEKYQQYLKVGAVKEEEQIIKDKSKSLGFAIRERYDAIEEDNLDFSKMDKQEFEEMFGNFDETMETIKLEDIKIAEQERLEEEKAQKQAEPEPAKSKKGRGKDKNEGPQKGGKQKKEKAKKQE